MVFVSYLSWQFFLTLVCSMLSSDLVHLTYLIPAEGPAPEPTFLAPLHLHMLQLQSHPVDRDGTQGRWMSPGFPIQLLICPTSAFSCFGLPSLTSMFFLASPATAVPGSWLLQEPQARPCLRALWSSACPPVLLSSCSGSSADAWLLCGLLG